MIWFQLLFAVVLFDNIRVRLTLRRLKVSQAEIVSNALGNCTLVDDLELPLPQDKRWNMHPTEAANGTKFYVLALGSVRVSENGGVYIGENATSTALRIDVTASTKKYCAAVWKAYRSRLARKSIDSSDNSI